MFSTNIPYTLNKQYALNSCMRLITGICGICLNNGIYPLYIKTHSSMSCGPRSWPMQHQEYNEVCYKLFMATIGQPKSCQNWQLSATQTSGHPKLPILATSGHPKLTILATSGNPKVANIGNFCVSLSNHK